MALLRRALWFGPFAGTTGMNEINERVIVTALRLRLASPVPEDLVGLIKSKMWEPLYAPYRRLPAQHT
jgi:hypothetical protein